MSRSCNSCDQNSALNWCSNLHLVFLCNTYFYNNYSRIPVYLGRKYVPPEEICVFSLSCFLLVASFASCCLLQTGAQMCTVHLMRAIKSSDSTRRRLSMNIAISKTRQWRRALPSPPERDTLNFPLSKSCWYGNTFTACRSNHLLKCQEQQMKRREVQDRSSLCSKNIFQEVSLGSPFALPSDWKYIIASYWLRSHLCKIANETQHAGGCFVSRNIVVIVQELC